MSSLWSRMKPAAASSPASSTHAATFQNRKGTRMPRYGGSSAPSTGAVKTETRRSAASAHCRTWFSRPTQSSSDWLNTAACGAAFGYTNVASVAAFASATVPQPGIAAADEVPAVEVVGGVDGRAGLRALRHARVELPVAGAREIVEPGAVDVDSGHRGEAPDRVQADREVRVGEGDGLRVAEGHRQRHLHRQERRVIADGDGCRVQGIMSPSCRGIRCRTRCARLSVASGTPTGDARVCRSAANVRRDLPRRGARGSGGPRHATSRAVGPSHSPRPVPSRAPPC